MQNHGDEAVYSQQMLQYVDVTYIYLLLHCMLISNNLSQAREMVKK